MTNSDAHTKLTGVILAGGQSKRFGSDKAWADLCGRPLLDWVAHALQAVCDELVVVHSRGQALPPLDARVPLRFVQDRFEALGPLAGLVTAFPHVRTALCFAASTDAPLLRPELVRYLVGLAQGDDAAVIPRVDGYLQPLVAVYRPTACLPAFDRHLADRDGRILAALEGLPVREMPESRVVAVDPDLGSFRNANTPARLDEIRRLLDARPRGSGPDPRQ